MIDLPGFCIQKRWHLGNDPYLLDAAGLRPLHPFFMIPLYEDIKWQA